MEDPDVNFLWGVLSLVALIFFSLNTISKFALNFEKSEFSDLRAKRALTFAQWTWALVFYSGLNGFFVFKDPLALCLSLVGSSLGLYLWQALLAQMLTEKNHTRYLQRSRWLKVSAQFIFSPFLKLEDHLNAKAAKSGAPEDELLDTLVTTFEEQRSEGVLDPDKYEMISGVLSLHDKAAREVMVPRTDAFMIDITNDNDRNIDSILEMDYSRIPVYHEDKDNIVGIVHLKNVLKYARRYGFERLTIRQVMRPAFFVPETMPIDELLYQMKKTQNQMAILLDEYGGVVGLTTLEDLLEEIVGEIDDESDEPDKLVKKVDHKTYLVQGKMTLNEFNDEFDTELSINDVDTIAGYIIAKTGKIPDDGEVLTVKVDETLTLKTKEIVDDARITQVLACFTMTEE